MNEQKTGIQQPNKMTYKTTKFKMIKAKKQYLYRIKMKTNDIIVDITER